MCCHFVMTLVIKKLAKELTSPSIFEFKQGINKLVLPQDQIYKRLLNFSGMQGISGLAKTMVEAGRDKAYRLIIVHAF